MASENETVEDIVKRVNRDCNSYPLPTAAAEMLKLVREMDAAHQREVAELRECLRMAVVNTRIARTCYAFGRECGNCDQSCDARKWNKVIEVTKGVEDECK